MSTNLVTLSTSVGVSSSQPRKEGLAQRIQQFERTAPKPTVLQTVEQVVQDVRDRNSGELNSRLEIFEQFSARPPRRRESLLTPEEVMIERRARATGELASLCRVFEPNV